MTTKHSGAAAVAEMATAVGRGVEAAEEQGKAIICTAKMAVEAAANNAKTRGDGGAGKPSSSSSSLKRSLECFLEGRKNKAPPSSATRRHLESSTSASSLSSSSSSN